MEATSSVEFGGWPEARQRWPQRFQRAVFGERAGLGVEGEEVARIAHCRKHPLPMVRASPTAPQRSSPPDRPQPGRRVDFREGLVRP